MVTLETRQGGEDRLNIQQKLEHHWMLDSTVAQEFAMSATPEGCAHIYDLLSQIENQPDAVGRRDEHRKEVIRIFNGESDEQLFIIGPCSLDEKTDYTELFDYIEELQGAHPHAVIGWRGNGAKPRSGTGNTGLFNSTIPGRRRKQLDIYNEAFRRGIPIFTEITDKDQLGMLAPYLTCAWAGARDMGSTELRKTISAYQLPVMIKNGTDGKISTLFNAITSVGKNTEDNKGAGVSLGHIASTCKHEDGGPTMFTVGKGNKHVAIIARGYDLDEEVFDGKEILTVSNLTEEEREQKAIEHLSKICMLAAKVKCAAIIDGSHDVPGMFSIKKKDGHRFIKVLKKFRRAAQEGHIEKVNHIRGFLGEVSVSEGETDINLVLDDDTKRSLTLEISEFQALDQIT